MPAAITEAVWLKRVRARHGNTYDYSRVVFKDYRTPVTIRCKVHGLFEQHPRYHTFCGCPKCGLEKPRKYTTESFVAKAKLVHGDRYDYSKTKFTNIVHKLTVVCRVHGDFSQSAHNHLNGHGCPKCKGEDASLRMVSGKQTYPRTKLERVDGQLFLVSSNSELKVAAVLKRTGMKVLDQRKVPTVTYEYNRKTRRYRPDFFLPEKNRLIEVKSDYTLGLLNSTHARAEFTKTKRKADASFQAGFDHRVVLVGRGVVCPLPLEWLTWSRSKVKRYYDDYSYRTNGR